MNNKKKMAQRLAKLKDEAIKKLKEQKIYKGPQSDLLDNTKGNPKNDKIKTEIKITASNLKEYLKLNEELNTDLDLDSIFNEGQEDVTVDDDLDVKSIDSLLAELEDAESVVTEDKPEPINSGNGPRDGSGPGCNPDRPEPINSGNGPRDGSGPGCNSTEDVDDVDDVEIASPEIQNRLKTVIDDIQTIKVNMLNEEMVEELDSIFSFKEESDGDVDVNLDDDEDIMASIDSIFNEISEDGDITSNDLDNIKMKMNNLFKEIDGEGLDTDVLENLFNDIDLKEDEPDLELDSLENLFKEDEPDLELDSIFSDDPIDSSSADIVI